MIFRFKALWILLGMVAVASAAAAVITVTPVGAQFAGVIFQTLGVGVGDVAKTEKIEKGSTFIDVRKVTIQPGATVPWHCHPGPVLFVQTEGTLTGYPAGESPVATGPGSAMVEATGEVRSAQNLGTVDVVGYIIFVHPKGTPPTILVDGPDSKCPH